MIRSRRMEPVARVAAHREQSAARSLAQQQERLAGQRAQLDELLHYRGEYAAQFQARAGGGVSATALQDYRKFMEKLDRAIQQQRLVIERQELEVERCRQQWIELRTRCDAMGKVVERFRSEERREADRREQSELDDHSAQADARQSK
ncbi:MAG: hypothetical protein Kow006_24010 [Gammaproteobacteria bacterium]